MKNDKAQLEFIKELQDLAEQAANLGTRMDICMSSYKLAVKEGDMQESDVQRENLHSIIDLQLDLIFMMEQHYTRMLKATPINIRPIMRNLFEQLRNSRDKS